MAEYTQQHRKKCPFCKDKVTEIDYKDVQALRRFITDRGKIKSRRVTGVCAQHQHKLAVSVKRAREMALLPYVVKVSSSGGRRNRS